MPPEKDMKMHHGQGPKLPLGWGACKGCMGCMGDGLLATAGLDPSGIHVKSYRISYEFI